MRNTLTVRTISFSGYIWECKRTDSRVGPGPNHFSDAPSLVSVSDTGELHLSLTQEDGIWKSSEVGLEKPLGFGLYRFTVTSSLHDLDTEAVFGAFLYESDTQEIDIEVSKRMIGPYLGQFAVQPVNTRSAYTRFPLPALPTEYAILWTSTRLYLSVHALHPVGARESLASWAYPTSGIHSSEYARFIFNLWAFQGRTPRTSSTVSISTFSFTPYPLS